LAGIAEGQLALGETSGLAAGLVSSDGAADVIGAVDTDGLLVVVLQPPTNRAAAMARMARAVFMVWMLQLRSRGDTPGVWAEGVVARRR
jgi:hypothetical protein